MTDSFVHFCNVLFDKLFCRESGMCPPYGHPPLWIVFPRNLGCAHRMAIHPCSKVAKYLGWAHRMAIHPCSKLQGVLDEPTVWPSSLVKYICKGCGMYPPYGHPPLSLNSIFRINSISYPTNSYNILLTLQMAEFGMREFTC